MLPDADEEVQIARLRSGDGSARSRELSDHRGAVQSTPGRTCASWRSKRSIPNPDSSRVTGVKKPPAGCVRARTRNAGERRKWTEHGVEAHAARIAEIVQSARSAPGLGRESRWGWSFSRTSTTCTARACGGFSRSSGELGGKGLIERMVSDPSVKTLFVLYDLIPSEPLTPVQASGSVSAPYESGFVPLSSVEGLHVEPSWHVAFDRGDLPDGRLHAVEVDGTPLLLAASEGRVFAYRNSCGGSILPLHLGTLVNGEIHCPWHGCRYDVTTGDKIGADGGASRRSARASTATRSAWPSRPRRDALEAGATS